MFNIIVEANAMNGNFHAAKELEERALSYNIKLGKSVPNSVLRAMINTDNQDNVLTQSHTEKWDKIINYYNEHFGIKRNSPDISTFEKLIFCCEKYSQRDQATVWFDQYLDRCIFEKKIPKKDVCQSLERLLGIEGCKMYSDSLSEQYLQIVLDAVKIPKTYEFYEDLIYIPDKTVHYGGFTDLPDTKMYS